MSATLPSRGTRGASKGGGDVEVAALYVRSYYLYDMYISDDANTGAGPNRGLLERPVTHVCTAELPGS